jgi:hypothetical protein
MVYGMQYRTGAILLVILTLACTAGCTNPISSPPAPAAILVPTSQPTPENPKATVPASDMALQPGDLPSDYILRDRSVMISPEVTQLTRDLGWTQGYFVTYDRTGRTKSDQTRVRQAISIFPVENMKKVYTFEKQALEDTGNSLYSPFEIPFPATGDRSIAYRKTDSPEPGQVTYTVIFTRKNAFERITMTGTSTDYETLKDAVQKAAAKIR